MSVKFQHFFSEMMDVIADWLCEVTPAQQSEKVYSGSEQKKKKK